MKAISSFLILISILSCSAEQSKIKSAIDNDRNEITQIAPPKLFYVDFKNPDCKIQIDSAKKDIKNNKLTFVDPLDLASLRYEYEIKEILSEYHIDYIIAGENCTLEQECFAFYMDSIISQKFGSSFISSIRRQADSLFLAQWETKEYMYWNIDKDPTYSEQSAEQFILDRLNYPKAWDTIPMKYERQYLMIELLIGNEGRIKEWTYSDIQNIKKSNQKFVGHLHKQIKNIVSNMKLWNPGRLEGNKVNSRILIDINLDKNE